VLLLKEPLWPERTALNAAAAGQAGVALGVLEREGVTAALRLTEGVTPPV